MKRVFTRRYKAIIQELRIAREEAGLTQEEMAKRFDTKQTTISKIERGERKLDILGFMDWCHITKADPCAILKRIPR